MHTRLQPITKITLVVTSLHIAKVRLNEDVDVVLTNSLITCTRYFDNFLSCDHYDFSLIYLNMCIRTRFHFTWRIETE